MDLDTFCHKLESLNLSTTDQALSLLWFFDEKTADVAMTAGELARLIPQSGLGNPHSTRLTESLRKSGLVLQKGSNFSLKVLARTKMRDLLTPILAPAPPKVDQDLGYLPKQVREKTRGYIEK